MKRILAAALALCTLFAAVPALAVDAGEKRVTMGANLDEAQKAQIYQDFNITPGAVEELIVTNADERAYLSGLVPDSKIGSVALSCIYIETVESGGGLAITTKNINWCTGAMYENALLTAGVTDAVVKVSAPFPVSGTAALTGAYKAYEDITGIELDALAKSLGMEELVITGELGEQIGGADAATIVRELKKILDQTKNMTDDEVRQEIRAIAKAYNVEITDAQVEQLLSLARKLEGMDTDELQQRLKGLSDTVAAAKKAEGFFSAIGEGITNFFKSVGDFFGRIFGG